MEKRIFSVIMLSLLVISTLTLAFKIQTVRADPVPVTIYINADGSITPPTAPIYTADNITYTLTGNINVANNTDGIWVERNNTVLNGAGYTVTGSGSGNGVALYSRSNVTIINMTNENLTTGIYLSSSSNNTFSGNNVANDTYGFGVWYHSDNNVLSGNNAANNLYGISLDSSNNTLSDNNITANSNYGIVLYSCSNCTLSGNNAVNNSFGVLLSLASSNILSGNSLTNNGYGIELSSSSDNTVSGNNVTLSGSEGIFLSNSSENIFFHNNFMNSIQAYGIDSNNTWDDGYPAGGNYWSNYQGTDSYSGPYQNVTGSDGIGDTPYVVDANNTDHYPLMHPFVPYEGETIYINANGSITPPTAPIYTADNITYTLTGNITAIADGILVERNNIVLNGAGYILTGSGTNIGITLDYMSNVTVNNMTIKNFTTGIILDGSSNSALSGNNLANTPLGIELVSSPNNVLSGNNVANTQDGIWLSSSSGNTLLENNIGPGTNSGFGILLAGSSNNVLSRNNIINNVRGIGLKDSSENNTLSGNNITENTYEGIYLDSSSNNSIFHNNFINNAQQVYSGGSVNVWDDGYPSGGNYWSDYTGVDVKSGPYQNVTGSDGIGDTPYTIDANNRDNYPLMTPSAGVDDIAVTNVTGSKTVVGQGYYLNTSVTLANLGDFAEEFNVSICYMNSSQQIFYFPANLESIPKGNSLVVVLTSNTTGIPYGRYLVGAYASPVPGETNTTNNVFWWSWMNITIPGDINGDFKVSLTDLVLLANAYGTTPTSGGTPGTAHAWNPNADIDGNGIVGLTDLVILALHYGQHYP